MLADQVRATETRRESTISGPRPLDARSWLMASTNAFSAETVSADAGLAVRANDVIDAITDTTTATANRAMRLAISPLQVCPTEARWPHSAARRPWVSL